LTDELPAQRERGNKRVAAKLALAVLVFFAITSVVLLSASFFPSINDFSVSSVSILLSILLLIPLYVWVRTRRNVKEFSQQTDTKDKDLVLFRIFLLFTLAMIVRLPSVLAFSMPYEKTPLIFLLILAIVYVEEANLSAFGFKTKEMGKSLLHGLMVFVLLGVLVTTTFYYLLYLLTQQIPIESTSVVPVLLTLPFMTLCVGISEEGFFRGYVQTHLERIGTLKQAILAQAMLFGAWHFVWHLSPLDFVGMGQHVAETFFIGLLFGYFYSKSKNLVPLILAHGLLDSVPYGLITNHSAEVLITSLPIPNQILLYTLPYAFAGLAAFLFTKRFVSEIS
jgi:membrane protease YdiL (CAAX protease family)